MDQHYIHEEPHSPYYPTEPTVTNYVGFGVNGCILFSKGIANDGGNTGRGSGHLFPVLSLPTLVPAVNTCSLQALTMPFHKKIPKILSEADISALLDDEGVTEIGGGDLSGDTNDPDYSGESGTEEDDCEVDDAAHSQPT
ncbi:hypothetical protein O3P69_005249 [Scylla paramamosain]|uniref:Uncharacterized protein n=1 Tax=Scylla paramamosain TaxID=85552 RepID=A0AAW0UCN3_SCYPA